MEILHPRVINAPTGTLLPAAVIYSSSSLDTSGGLASDLRVGLGDIAEFGLATTDLIRRRAGADGEAERISPYFIATFKMGLPEHWLFRHQPALSLGFRKSFEREHLGRDTQVAGLYLVASKTFAPGSAIHVGGVFWDAEMTDEGGDPLVSLHEKPARDQVRPFGGLEIETLPDAQILVDLFWTPEFDYIDDDIRLTPTLAWGVRYDLRRAIALEAGVKVPDIQDANLIDAQIFGQVTFMSRRLRKWLVQ